MIHRQLSLPHPHPQSPPRPNPLPHPPQHNRRQIIHRQLLLPNPHPQSLPRPHPHPLTLLSHPHPQLDKSLIFIDLQGIFDLQYIICKLEKCVKQKLVYIESANSNTKNILWCKEKILDTREPVVYDNTGEKR